MNLSTSDFSGDAIDVGNPIVTGPCDSDMLVAAETTGLHRPSAHFRPVPDECSGHDLHWLRKRPMTSAPVMYDLEALDAEPLRDLRGTDELINIDATTHTRIVTYLAYLLTHPRLRDSSCQQRRERRATRRLRSRGMSRAIADAADLIKTHARSVMAARAQLTTAIAAALDVYESRDVAKAVGGVSPESLRRWTDPRKPTGPLAIDVIASMAADGS